MNERGFTLIETVVVVAIIAATAFGVYALAQPSVAVAAARDGIGGAFAEARAAASAEDSATVVIAPSADGGFVARVYARVPGDPGFIQRNGPPAEGRNVALSETAAPLGAPGMAFAISHFGEVVGYPNFAVGEASLTTIACPAAGAFVLQLHRSAQSAQYAIPCRRSVSGVAPAVSQTPSPSATVTPGAPLAGGCPPSELCAVPPLPVTAPPGCPSGYQPDPTQSGQCDLALATPTPLASPTSAPTSPPTTTPTPGPIVLAGYVVGMFSSDFANECGKGTIGGLFDTVVLAALTAPAAIGGEVPSGGGDAVLDGWYEHTQPCAGGFVGGSPLALAPIPNPTSLLDRVTDDLAAECAQLTPPCDPVTLFNVAGAFAQVAQSYADTPSPNGIVYGQNAYTASYTFQGILGVGSDQGAWIVTSAASP